MTRGAKKRAVLAVLRAHPDWGRRRVAQAAGCTQAWVSMVVTGARGRCPAPPGCRRNPVLTLHVEMSAGYFNALARLAEGHGVSPDEMAAALLNDMIAEEMGAGTAAEAAA